MSRVFVDTGFLVALILKSDKIHERALALTPVFNERSLTTNDLVFAEFLNFFSGSDPERGATVADMADRLRNDSRCESVELTDGLFNSALALYWSRSDKRWSFIDRASFVIMDELRITQALTFDKHFDQAGFHRVEELRQD